MADKLNETEAKPVPRWRRWLKRAFQRYLVDAMGAMAFGLFASLLIGLILQQFLGLIKWEPLQPLIDLITTYTAASSPVVGAAIGVAIAYGLKVKPLVIYSCATVGAIGYMVSSGGVSAGPVGAYLAVLVAAELGQLVAGKTKLDIILVPSVTIISGSIIALIAGPAVAGVMRGLGAFINQATELQPFGMGLIVSTVMSLILFSPLSSAAMSIMLGLESLAAGAATAGCAASMIGFAASSFRENRWGGVLAQGLGTSMLQIGNTLRHPAILLPPTIAAAVVGPLSTVVFKMENIALGSGMGTSGLVGQVTTWTTMIPYTNPALLALKIVLLHFIIPAAISLIVSEVMRKQGKIQFGWQTLEQ